MPLTALQLYVFRFTWFYSVCAWLSPLRCFLALEIAAASRNTHYSIRHTHDLVDDSSGWVLQCKATATGEAESTPPTGPRAASSAGARPLFQTCLARLPQHGYPLSGTSVPGQQLFAARRGNLVDLTLPCLGFAPPQPFFGSRQATSMDWAGLEWGSVGDGWEKFGWRRHAGDSRVVGVCMGDGVMRSTLRLMQHYCYSTHSSASRTIESAPRCFARCSHTQARGVAFR